MRKFTTTIIVDKYKMDKYKEALDQARFNDYTICSLELDSMVYMIKITSDISRVSEIGKICQELELFFETQQN